jgi:Protein of unknown function (DUF2480)
MKPVLNRVAKSPLITIDLEDFYPSGKRVVFDIAPWLYKGLILKEKEFRKQVSQHNWTNYTNTYVALNCSEDVIIPSWAYLLVSSNLTPFAKRVVVGDLNLLETVVFTEVINKLDLKQYINKPIIIKGCAGKPIPQTAFISLISKLQPVAKSIMYGEACSTVPIFKKKE